MVILRLVVTPDGDRLEPRQRHGHTGAAQERPPGKRIPAGKGASCEVRAHEKLTVEKEKQLTTKNTKKRWWDKSLTCPDFM